MLHAFRAVGVFALARRATRRDLRILCYHGFSLDDEHVWTPGLFIAPATLKRRLEHLRARGYPVLPLDEAIRRLAAGDLPDASVVITIDDGFAGTHSVALPLFKAFAVPVTLYLTTYYVEHQSPIYNLSLRYLLWQGRNTPIDLSELNVAGVAGRVDAGDASIPERERAAAALTEYGHLHFDRDGRDALLERLAGLLGLNYQEFVASRKLGLVRPDEIVELRDGGLNIELHTHRHWSPDRHDLSTREIRDNRAAIQKILPTAATHFCYPSGRSDRWNPAWLEETAVESATTCEPGFVSHRTDRFAMGRFLDGEHVLDIEFEAEVAGVYELVRRLRQSLRLERPPEFNTDPAECRPELAHGLHT
ncbi:MAG: polysaccharide deacetylase family protein [Candidatus Eremiobacteraeota bacterium]|nr:polysaccharide deacetylase family protein [Candidatus Eremiobacteraeota bacterium]